MAEIERTYIIPLRREWLKVQRYKRAKKAVAGLRKFLQRHMKSQDVRLGKFLNLELWKHGIRNPPSRIKVTVKKDDKNVVRAELFGALVEETEVKKEEKAEKKEEQKESKQDAEQESKPAEKKQVKKPVEQKQTVK